MPCKGHGGIEGVAIAVALTTAKVAPRCWYNRLASALEGIGFRASACNESLFLMGEGESLVLLLVYVDDILLFSSSDKEIDGVQRKLTEDFKKNGKWSHLCLPSSNS
ncbi:hypothetical protein CLOM_g4427 [Closterium sp. NIES-68]|nr:hypothetical protein CLOM_g4427 [Closterium sp. NIES-68]